MAEADTSEALLAAENGHHHESDGDEGPSGEVGPLLLD